MRGIVYNVQRTGHLRHKITRVLSLLCHSCARPYPVDKATTLQVRFRVCAAFH